MIELVGDAEAVLFDCDGVLVDTEPIALAAWKSVAATLGLAHRAHEAEDFVGMTDRDLAENFRQESGRSIPEIEAINRETFLRLAGGGISTYPDTMRLLDDLAGFPLAVGTNSARWRLDAVLAACGLADRFAASVAADEVVHPKPAPDIYLSAAAKLGVAPEGCVVFEDSPTGILSAKAAGCRVIAIARGYFPPGMLRAADVVVDGES